MTREGLAQLINNQPDMEVCALAGSPPEAFQKLSIVKPDLVLTDITMSGRSGTEFIKDILAFHAELPILVVSRHEELIYADRVLRAGARGYIMKEASGEKLLAAVRRVLSGHVYLSERMSDSLFNLLTGRPWKASTSPVDQLSDSEFEIFQLMGQGKSTRQIATQLHLSQKTVEAYGRRLQKKLDFTDAISLIRYAVRWMENQM